MSLITVYTGTPDLLEQIDVDIHIASVADYVPAYDQIARALHASEPLIIAVSDHSVAAWLKKMQARYGSDRIAIDRLTRRSRLQTQWGIPVPDWVSDHQIAAARLLDVKLEAPPGREFEDFVLDLYFSPYLAQQSIPRSHLDDLVHGYDRQKWEEHRSRPLIGDILQKRLHQWEQKAEHRGEHLLIEWLRTSPERLAQQLALYKVLSRYPVNVGEFVMGEAYLDLQPLELDLSQVRITETLVKPAVDHIQAHLEDIVQSEIPAVALRAMLEQVSGHLEIEFDAVEHLLRSGAVEIDDKLVRQVRQRFAPIKGRPYLDQALADLDLLVSQSPPSSPEDDWDDDQWLTWAVQEYLPYRFWLEEIGQLRGDVVEFAHRYSEWLYRRYPAMRYGSPQMIHRALPSLKEQMKSDAPVLVLIVDNFNAKFFSDFRRYMQEAGFFSESLDYYISLLPSCTEISKKALLTGKPEPFKGTGLEKPVLATWQHELPGRIVRYLPHIGALREIRRRDADVYFLNYLPLDIAFHQDEQQIGISHAQAVRSHLRALARDVRAFSLRIGAERDLQVITLSDHGSTRIPADAPNLIDPAFFANRVEDKHHRYVRISDKELSQLPENIRFQCYIFERGSFDLDENYLAAKQHYRFKPTSESVYVHGGLTPEETLVPVSVFLPAEVTLKELDIGLLQKDFRYGVRIEIPLVLANVNAYPCDSIRLEVMNPGVDIAPEDVGMVAAMSKKQVTLKGRIRRTRDDLSGLQIRITYNFLGKPCQQDVERPITMKSMMERSFDLEELI